MIKFENYKNNLNLDDKFNLQNVDTNTSMVYNGQIQTIEKKSPVNRDNKLRSLAAAVLGINNTSTPFPDNSEFYNCWTDIDAQELYLSSKPTCYLILNKPGAGAYSLGEAMSKKYNCVHLCPRNIINDEIEQESSTGATIDFNLKQNNILKFDNILTMLKKKLESPAIKHRGYVLSGFPLVTSSRNSLYLINSLYSEEGIEIVKKILFDFICNLKKKNQKKQLVSSESPHTSVTSELVIGEEEEPEEEEVVEDIGEENEEQMVALPKFLLESCSDVILHKKTYYDTKQTALLLQINELFNLSMKPDIIVYITCPDIDLVTKKSRKYLNYSSGLYTYYPFFIKHESETRWPERYPISDYLTPYDSHIFNPKYNCRQPMNYVENSIEQLCNYKQLIMPYIKDKIKEYSPKCVIKLDARITTYQMMHMLNETFITLPIKPIPIPEPLYLEDPPEDTEDFWKLVEELNVIRCGVINFNRYESLWFNRCPVELKKRQSVKGNAKFAVSFFKHVYLLSSLDSMIQFCRNPRPFLKLNYLEPTCRIIVIGTKSSGKTMISKCISWIFDAPIINYESFLNDEKRKKYDTFAKTILSEIIATIEDVRYEKWQNMESERISSLELWYNLNISYLKKYITMLAKKNYAQQKENDSEVEYYVPDAIFLKELNFLKERLSYLPFLENIVFCTIAAEEKKIIEYAPSELTTVTEKPKTPVLGDKDVTEAISAYILANELQQEIEPTVEELVNEIVKKLFDLDREIQETTDFEQSYGKYIIDGFPSDPEYWSHLSELYILPDITITLIENKEMEPKLYQNYIEIDNHLKNYQERFILANDPLIKTKLLTNIPPETKVTDIKIIIHDLINKSFSLTNTSTRPENAEGNLDPETLTSFAESFDKFREDWDSIKLKLEECSKHFIEVEIDIKTDIELIEEVLLKLRKSYFITGVANDDEDIEVQDDEDETPKDILAYNDSKRLCETNIYCPVTYYKYGVLWEGKPEFSVKYDNKINYFCKEEFFELFKKDITKYQYYNNPFKYFPPLRICVIGCIGSGKTAISKLIAKELGLFHLDFSEIVNEYLLPKHFKKIGRQHENQFTDIPIDEEGVIEFQMDEENENFVSNILTNELELSRMVYNYFERGVPILNVLMQKIIKKLWFDDPFKTTGFVLDGYPRLPVDVEDMIACYCIPDLIIELESNTETMLQRLSPKMYKTWKNQQSDAKAKARIKLCKAKEKWLDFITKKVVVKLICDEILEHMFLSQNLPMTDLSKESVIIDANPSGSTNVDSNLFNTYNEMIQEYPEPIDQSEWEKPEEARERLDSRLESIFEIDDENIQTIKDVLLEQRIKCVSIDGTKPLHKVLRFALSKLISLRNRCESFFEQTFIINIDIAEILLLEGFYFLSKFYRICPVYTYENPNAILNPYKINKRKGKIFPVIHRCYIYFIISKENVCKFRKNPLKYIQNNNLESFLEYPLRIGVIGPPKSGKSTLAERLSKEYGLLCLSKGKVLRYILKNMHWTELASRITVTLREGELINSNIVAKAVQTVAMDHRVITNGFVMDGFPESPSEAMELSRLGLYPLIIFDISAKEKSTLNYSQNEINFNILKRKPPYSRPFIEYRFKNWFATCNRMRDWVKDDYQNLYEIDGNHSKWQCVQEATNVINTIVNKVHFYMNNVNSKVVSADVMCISNELFRQRMSNFKNVCPLCLQHNVLKHSGYPVDRKGIVQYKNIFYWICEEHMGEVLNCPHYYLTNKKVEIPEIPALVKTINRSLVYENGICIVTYAENLPEQKIERGNNTFAANYHGKIYLFCSDDCLAKFMAKPHMYYDIFVFKTNDIFPKLTLKKLPNLGYLEQTVGNIITDACCSVNVLRPKYPGLDIKTSALLYIALYLKIHNPVLDKSVIGMYEKAFKLYRARCKLLIDIGLRLRSMDNPFAYYPNCCGLNNYDSGTVRKPSTIVRSSTTLSDFN
ncbi:adenylate kinase 9-like [Aphomia sociella]